MGHSKAQDAAARPKLQGGSGPSVKVLLGVVNGEPVVRTTRNRRSDPGARAIGVGSSCVALAAMAQRTKLAPLAPDLGPDLGPDLAPDLAPELAPQLAPRVGRSVGPQILAPVAVSLLQPALRFRDVGLARLRRRHGARRSVHRRAEGQGLSQPGRDGMAPAPTPVTRASMAGAASDPALRAANALGPSANWRDTGRPATLGAWDTCTADRFSRGWPAPAA